MSLGAEHRRDGSWGPSGTPATIDVEVRPEHIAAGLVGDAGACPIALACRVALRVGAAAKGPPMQAPRVDGMLVHFTHRGHRLSVALPARALRWQQQFDRGEPVSPFSFLLPCYSLADQG